MASNEKMIHENYVTKREEQRVYGSKAAGLEFHFTKKLLEKYVSKQSKVVEIGCGTGYYRMFLSDKCKEYTGIDLIPENLEVFNEKIEKEKITNNSMPLKENRIKRKREYFNNINANMRLIADVVMDMGSVSAQAATDKVLAVLEGLFE